MFKVTSAADSRANDKLAIEGGIRSAELMARAAQSLYDCLRAKAGRDKKVAVVCGRGNNGGDGLALAQILLSEGYEPSVFLVEGKLSDDCSFYLKKLYEAGISPQVIDENLSLKGYAVVVDALYGTGISRALAQSDLKIIDAINESGAYILSCDIPSGLSADNGIAFGGAVHADETVTFASAKCGNFLNDGIDYTGVLNVCDIGIENQRYSAQVAQSLDMRKFFAARRRNIHKGINGSGAIVGGSRNFVGAPMMTLAATSALRVGSGITALVVPECVYPSVAKRAVENVLVSVPDDGNVMRFDEKALEKLSGFKAAAIGMGLGECSDVNKIILYLLKNTQLNLILDADALNNLDIEILHGFGGRVLLTPHPKEFSRLFGVSVEKVLSNGIYEAKLFAKKYGVNILLKGSSSIITDGHRVVINTRGSSAMAKGGSGDVLDGVILGFAARGFNLFESAYAGAYLIGRAAEIAVENCGNDYSLLPSETVGYLKNAVTEIVGEKKAAFFAALKQ